MHVRVRYDNSHTLARPAAGRTIRAARLQLNNHVLPVVRTQQHVGGYGTWGSIANFNCKYPNRGYSELCVLLERAVANFRSNLARATVVQLTQICWFFGAQCQEVQAFYWSFIRSLIFPFKQRLHVPAAWWNNEFASFISRNVPTFTET